MRLVICVLLLLMGASLSSQELSGYMGRKNSIEVGPALSVLGLQPSWTAAYHRVVGRKTEIGVQYYNVSGELYEQSQYESYKSGATTIGYTLNGRNRRSTGPITAQYIGIDFRYYLSEYIAPVGTSMEMGFGQYIAKGSENNEVVAYVQSEGEYVKIPANHTYNHFRLGAAKKYILGGGKLYSELGATVNYFWSADAPRKSQGSVRSKDLVFAQTFVRDQVGLNLIRIRVGFGYIF